MTVSARAPALERVAAPAGYVAAALALAALPLFVVVVGDGTISGAATSPGFFAPTLAMLGSTIALLVALVALYVPRANLLGAAGTAGFLVAMVGTVLAAGGAWSYVFVVPYVAADAPSLVDESSGSLLAGFVLSYLLMGLGWLAVGVVLHRARLVPRRVTWLLVVGAVVTIVPMPSRSLLLALAVAWLGHLTARGQS